MDFSNFIACPRCGDKVPVTARFCGNCRLEITATMRGPQSSRVPSMGSGYQAQGGSAPVGGHDPAAPVQYPRYPGPPGPVQEEPIAGSAGKAAQGARLNRPFSGLMQRLSRRSGSGAAAAGGLAGLPGPNQIGMSNSAPAGSRSLLPHQAEHPVGEDTRRSTPAEPFPEPPGMAPDRAIVLSINRSPAESRIDLPVVRVEQVEPRLEVQPEPRPLPREEPVLAHATPVIVPQRQPDGKGAPLPRNKKQIRRRLIAAGLAFVVIGVVVGFALWRLLAPEKDPTLVVPGQLGNFPRSNSLAAYSLLLQANQSEIDQNNHLPELSTSAAATFRESPLAHSLVGYQGLGQAQMGISAPMDVSVASYGQYVVEAVDAGLQIIDTKKATAPLSLGFVQFFHPLMHAGDVFGEPRVIFDPVGQQWALVVNEVTVSSGNTVASYFDVAISLTSSPLGSWRIYQIPTQVQEYSACNWADAPQLGSNVLGFFITGTSFNCGVTVTLYGPVLWELPRATYGKGERHPPAPLSWINFNGAPQQPLFSLTPAVEAGSTATEWLIGNDAGYVGDGQVSQRLYLWAVGPNSSPGAGQTLPHVSVPLGIPYADPPEARQPPLNTGSSQPTPTPRLRTGDARIASAEFINGHLYTAFTTAVNWQGDTTRSGIATRSGIYWLDLMPKVSQSDTLSVKVAQAGILGLPGAYLFMPTLVVDAEGNLALAAVLSSIRTYNPSLVYTSHRSTDPKGKMALGLGHGNALALLQKGAIPIGFIGDYMGGGLVVHDSKQASSGIWMATPVIELGSANGNIVASWGTKMWEFNTGGDSIQPIS